ncbi:Putative Zinc finger C2H2-type [Septoria linicola]|uniref:Zinc finger C2H2-type n=1 Tax=Septoria linicola TaxID=215465 RepID=A0A9Q9APK2_9PEZI|nr:Putative Zinc finger C2H2-type [Septoria linicola]
MRSSRECLSTSTQDRHPHYLAAPYAPLFTTPLYNSASTYEPQIYQQALALLQQSASYHNSCDNHIDATSSVTKSHSQLPRFAVQAPSASHFPQHTATTTTGLRHDSAVPNATVDWQSQQMYGAPYNNNLGGLDYSHGTKRQRTHQRTPSASTVASTGPASPYTHSHTVSHPQIANTDRVPESPANFSFADQALYPKYPAQTSSAGEFGISGSVPSAAAHMSNAHLAMKNFGFDYHNSEEFNDFPPSRQSMSSYGNDSPATPQSGAGEVDAKAYNVTQQNGENELNVSCAAYECLLFDESDYKQQPNPHVQLFRTESAAYQDELYNPNQVYASSAPKALTQQQQSSYLSPHRNLITERLQTANLARSTSPASAISRDRSPFRDGSPLAPTKDWNPQIQDGRVGTAASMRQQQKDAATEAEYARNRAPLRREPTKTISPKDALLDYNENDQPPLFQDGIPTGYKQHLSGTEQWPSSSYMGAPSVNFAGLPVDGQQNMSFRNATSADTDLSGAGFDFTSLPQSTGQMSNNPFQTNYQAAIAAQMNNHSDSTPPFPAGLPSMETSISDAGFPQSSQESVATGPATTSAPQRPSDTRANTGTYTCTYHGCTQRFGSHNELQKHKREYHRSQQKNHESTSPASAAEDSSSPRSTASPAPSTSGMTSAAILARNSQAGPHKCTRINPSTGKPCNTIFSRPYDLTRHEDTIHNNRKHKVRCPMCREEKTFSRNDALTRHMRVVHPEVETMGKRPRRGD